MVTWPWTNYYIVLCLIHYGCVYCTYKLRFFFCKSGPNLTRILYFTIFTGAKNMTDLADFTNCWNCSSSTQFAGVPSSLLPWFNRSFFCSCVVSWQHTTFAAFWTTAVSSVLRYCWLGDRKGIQPLKPVPFVPKEPTEEESGNTAEENSSIFSNPNALAIISKGMWTVKLCSNKILQFLTGVPASAGCPA